MVQRKLPHVGSSESDIRPSGCATEQAIALLKDEVEARGVISRSRISKEEE